MEKQEKKPLSQRYEVGLMVVSVIIVAALVAGISIFPAKGKEVAAAAMHMMTYTFGSTMQFITVIILIFLVALGFSKYGSIRLGKEKPDYKTLQLGGHDVLHRSRRRHCLLGLPGVGLPLQRRPSAGGHRGHRGLRL